MDGACSFISFPLASGLGLRAIEAKWRLRVVIRLHCAASAQGFAEERLESTGRGLGARWKQPHVSPSPPNDPQGRKWVGVEELSTARHSTAQHSITQHSRGAGESIPTRRAVPVLCSLAPSQQPTNAKLRRVTAANKLSPSLRSARRGKVDQQSTAEHSLFACINTTVWQSQFADTLRLLHWSK